MAGRKQFSNTVEVAGGSVLGLNSIYGNVEVGLLAVQLKIGQDNLINRTGVFVQSSPDNTDNVYIGLDDTVDSLKAFFCLSPGNAISIDIDTDNNVPLWAISATDAQIIYLCEVKK